MKRVSFYVDLLRKLRPSRLRRQLLQRNLGACTTKANVVMWIDATIAASFLESPDGVAYAQSPNAGNPVGANWLVGMGNGSSYRFTKLQKLQTHFIEWATSKAYVQAVANHPDFGWASVPTGTASLYVCIS